MGLSIGFSKCKHSNEIIEINTGNPNPYNHSVSDYLVIGNAVVMKVVYPDCKNYEGTKIMVYDKTMLDNLYNGDSLDPHFCDDCKLSPLARFKPDDEGWAWAINFCQIIKNRGI